MHPRPGAITAAVLCAPVVAMVGTVASPAGAVAPGTGTVFVNEIHYDDDGTDAGEAVEVAGPAGTDLTGWSVVLYNGSGGTTYGTAQVLDGPIPDQAGGFGTVSVGYPSNGIQNGAPDGVALVDAAGAVVQFLSYEGTVTAVGGPADGSTSTDVGVAEGTSTPVGSSLQLTGSGDTYGDFTWASPAASSFGALNAGHTFREGAGGDGGGGEPIPEPCDLAVTHEIGAVQGAGDQSRTTLVDTTRPWTGDLGDPSRSGGSAAPISQAQRPSGGPDARNVSIDATSASSPSAGGGGSAVPMGPIQASRRTSTIIPSAQSPYVRDERLDLHNAGIDELAAVAGRCGTIHLPTGRTCRAPARHTDGCDFELPSCR